MNPGLELADVTCNPNRPTPDPNLNKLKPYCELGPQIPRLLPKEVSSGGLREGPATGLFYGFN